MATESPLARVAALHVMILPMKKPKEKRKYSCIFLEWMSNAFILQRCTYWNNDRLNLINTGMGRIMSMMSVIMFSTPAHWSAYLAFGGQCYLPSVISCTWAWLHFPGSGRTRQ